MRDAMRFLLSFEGRLSQRSWWIAFLIVLSITIGGMFAAHPAYFIDDDVPAPNAALLAVQTAMLWPSFAITKRRFNDRGWGDWLFWVIVAIFVPLHVVDIVCFGVNTFDVFMAPILERGLAEATVGQIAFCASFVAMSIAGVFLIIDNGFGPGVPGPNAHGPDPRAS
ncbi:MAG: DUF805 domain-containing protein [Pseudomonadota bacterium]